VRLIDDANNFAKVNYRNRELLNSILLPTCRTHLNKTETKIY